jgi:hypothetical protein
MAKEKQDTNWRETFKKWYVSFAFVGIIGSVIFGVLDRLGFEWVKAMKEAFGIYFDVAFLLAFILLGIFIYWPSRKTKDNKNRNDIKEPYLNIQINSKDFKRKNTQEIIYFFKGVKQIFVEYRKFIKETHKYEQTTVKKQDK